MTGAFSMDIKLEQSKDLKSYNSLAISAVAEYFCSVQDIDQLKYALLFAKNNSLEVMPIGGGSNLVIASDLSGLVVHIDLKGLSILSSTQDKVEICFSAGENWHAMVTHCLDNGWYGLENLALIPGDMGAAPIQNIGAYGEEISNFIDHVECFDLDTNMQTKLTRSECKFGYRKSIFQESENLLITAVSFYLSKKFAPKLHYKDLKDYAYARSLGLQPKNSSGVEARKTLQEAGA